jgi:adenylate cyclase class 2
VRGVAGTLVADDGDIAAAPGEVRKVLQQLGVEDCDLTTELYTDAVSKGRAAK